MKIIIIASLIFSSFVSIGKSAKNYTIPEETSNEYPAVPKLISSVKQVSPGSTFDIGYYFKIKKGWHIYWVNPGDSGQEPQLRWKEFPKGVQFSEIQWPIPCKYRGSTLVSYGYEGIVLLPLKVTLPKTLTGNRLILKAKARWLACSENCIMKKGLLKLDLPMDVKSIPDTRWKKEFERARKTLPLKNKSPVISASQSKNTMNIKLDKRFFGEREAIFFPYKEGTIEDHANQVIRIEDQTIQLTINFDGGLNKVPGNMRGLISDGKKCPLKRAYEVELLLNP